MKYYIRAKQGESRFFLTKTLRVLSPQDTGYLYDKKQKIFTKAGQELFKWGYWEDASGTIDIPNNEPKDGNPDKRP